jgi:peptidoglycan/xylan/chitin deacetylase (PgdA/CDA1 family)
MHWSHHKMIVAWTGAMILLSSDIGRQTEGPSVAATEKLAASSMPASGANVSRSGRHATDHSLPAADGHAAQPFRIYLTFDDGPSSGSQLVNDLSQKDGLPINVFLIGRNVCATHKSRLLFQEYRVNPLVEIGNHSYTHAERHYKSWFKQPLLVLADFDRSRDSLGQTNRLTRLPGRNFFRLDSLSRDESSNGKEAADTLAARGYAVFGWDLEWRSHAGNGIQTHTGKEMIDLVGVMLEKQKTFLPGRVIILLHDPELKNEAFKNELEEFIRLAKEDGRFSFEHLSEYVAPQ